MGVGATIVDQSGACSNHTRIKNGIDYQVCFWSGITSGGIRSKGKEILYLVLAENGVDFEWKCMSERKRRERGDFSN